MAALIPATRAPQADSSNQLATDVRRALLTEDGLDIASLVVRRIPNGVCLEGVIHVHGDDVDVCRAIRKLDGVGEILNHLVVCWNCPEPGPQVTEDDIF
jgi:osmotically-inducible protein OsmY